MSDLRDGDDGETIMGAIDRADDGRRFVVADVARDGAWLAVRAAEALSLPKWR